MLKTGEENVQYATVVTQSAPEQPALSRGDQGFYTDAPRRIQCQFCQYDVLTGTVKETGRGTHLVALGLCCTGMWPCVCLPYLTGSCKDTVHVCPNCHAAVGKRTVL